MPRVELWFSEDDHHPHGWHRVYASVEEAVREGAIDTQYGLKPEGVYERTDTPRDDPGGKRAKRGRKLAGAADFKRAAKELRK